MRIEIDKNLAKLLDDVKTKEPTIYGRGHAETVRFLANYYSAHKPLQALVEDVDAKVTEFLNNMDASLQQSLERVFPKALAKTITTILTMAPSETETSHTTDPVAAPGSQLEDVERTPRVGPGERSTARERHQTATKGR